MPHIWNHIMVVTQEELVPAWWKDYKALKHELWRYKSKNYGIKRAQLGGNGRQLLVRFDSLPKHVQDGIGNPTQLAHPLEPYYVTDSEAINFYTNFKRPSYGHLKPEEYERYITNSSVIKAILKLEKARVTERLTKGGSVRASKGVRSVSETLHHDALTFQEVLQKKHDVQHSLPSHPRKFKEKINDFNSSNGGYEFNYLALIKDAEGKKIKNAQKANDYTYEILDKLFGKQTDKPSATEVARQYEGFLTGYVEIINPDTGEVYSNQGLSELSINTITNYLATWKSQIATHALRSGDRQKLMQKFEPYHSLIQPTFAGSLISIDDRNPPFKNEDGKRIWFYNGIDLASECFTTWVWGLTKEGIILDFYRQMVRNYHAWGWNLPAGLECESSLNASYKNTLLKEGVMFENVRIEANNARGKRIEAYFSPLRYGLEKKREGWIARPFAASEKNQIGSAPELRIPSDQIAEGAIQDLVTWNNMPHSKHPEVTRWEYCRDNQNPDLKPTNYKAILPHLGYATVSSCNAGIIHLQNSEWLLGENGTISTGENLIQLMTKVESKTIEVRWLDDVKGNVFIAYIYIDSQFICEAIAKPMYPRAVKEQKPEHKAAQDLITRYAATIQGYQRTQKNQIEDVIVIDNRPLTLNNGFQVPGARKTNSVKEPTGEILENQEKEYNHTQTAPISERKWANNFNH